MTIRILAAVLAAAAAVPAATASAADASTTAVVSCGKIAAGGKTWDVSAARVRCATARSIVAKVAVTKPDHVIRAQGGEIDQFASTFSGFRCVRTRRQHVAGGINCTNKLGTATVLGSYRG